MVGTAGLAGGLLLLAGALLELLGQGLGALGGGAGGAAVLLDVLAGLRGTGLGGLALLGHLGLLGVGGVELGLQAAALGGDGGKLAGEAGDVALCGGLRVAGLGKRELRGVGGLASGVQCLLELGHSGGKRADAALALQGAGLVGGHGAHVDATVRQHHDAVFGDVGESGRLLVGGHGGSRALDQADVPQKRCEHAAGLIGYAQARDERLSGRALAGDDRGAAVHAVKRECRLGKAPGRLGVCHHEGGEIVAKQALHQTLDLRRGVDEVGQAAIGGAGLLGACELGHEGAGLLHVRVHGTQGLQGGLGTGEALAAGRLLAAGVFHRHVASGHRGGQLLGQLLGAGKLVLELLGALQALHKGLLGRAHGLVELCQARGKHLVLDLSVSDLVLELGVGQGLPVGLAAGASLLGGQAADLGVELAAAVGGGVGRVGEVGDLGAQVGLAHGGVGELASKALVLQEGVGALLLHDGELHAHLGEARDHVLALLLKEAHVRVHPAEDVLHAAALLAEVSHEETLLLEERLELLELAALLVKAVLGKLDGGVRLLTAALQTHVGLLELAQVVYGQLDGELGELGVELAGALGLVDLALERLELAGDLAREHLGAGKVLVHGGELAHAALLAAPVLGDVRGLLDELAALLGAAGEDGVQLALGDDGVGVLAQAGVVQDVLDVHEAAGGAVDEVLGLSRAVHAASDAHLGEVDGQRVVRVVEHEGDLGHADGAARGGAREDDVLHGLAAQHLCALLAQDPQDGVGHVGLARAVGPHHHGEARVKDHLGLVGKGLEALERE